MIPTTTDPDDSGPVVHVDLRAVRENTKAVCERVDGSVVGVTKAVAGDPAVAAAMVAGGVDGVGDSRLVNLKRVGEHLGVERTLLKGPTLDDLEQVVRHTERSLHSESVVVAELADTASRIGTTHDVVLMVDTGDRREGVLPGDALDLLRATVDLAGIRVVGLGTNTGCFGGVLPTPTSMREFVAVVEDVEAALDREFPVVSGGSTVTLPLVEDGTLPARVTELRVGEAILLGTDVSRGRTVEYLRRDAFALEASVIECKRKPSTPAGETGRTVDGTSPEFEDRGLRSRAVLALGRQDTVPSELAPLADGVEVLGASSDHLVCDVTDATDPVAVGDSLRFRMGYGALSRAFASEYVGRTVVGD